MVDVGKFVTPMGAEVIESKDNWNYSRGLLFTWAIPFYHFGARAKYTFNDKYSATGCVLNGWNNIVENNSGKTYGMTFGWNPNKKTSATVNYLAGPEQATGAYGPTINVNDIWRQTWDAMVMYSPNTKLSFMANFDYGRGDRSFVNIPTKVYWTGGAGYVKYALDDKDYVAARYEYFEDHDGFMTMTSSPGGIPIPRLHINEITATYQRTVAAHLLTRLEFRRDKANFPVFPYSHFTPLVKDQNTATLGLIFLFDSREAK